MSDDEIRARLVQAREARGLSRPVAAETMVIPYQTYAGHENGHGGGLFSVESAIRYAAFYGVSLDWLLTGTGYEPPVPSPATEHAASLTLAEVAGIDLDAAPEPTRQIVAMLVVSAVRVLKVHTGEAA